MVEGNGLLNRRTANVVPGVRIPPSPPLSLRNAESDPCEANLSSIPHGGQTTKSPICSRTLTSIHAELHLFLHLALREGHLVMVSQSWRMTAGNREARSEKALYLTDGLKQLNRDPVTRQ